MLEGSGKTNETGKEQTNHRHHRCLHKTRRHNADFQPQDEDHRTSLCFLLFIHPIHQNQIAQIIPLGIGNYNAKVQDLNKAIVPWAQGLNKTESPIWVVDQYTGYSGSTDNRDGIHPNDNGDTKMAGVWYPAVVRAFEAARGDKTETAVVGRRFVV